MVSQLKNDQDRRAIFFRQQGAVGLGVGAVTAVVAMGLLNIDGQGAAVLAGVVGVSTIVIALVVNLWLAAGKDAEPDLMLAMRGASDGLWVWDINKDEVIITQRINEIMGTSLPLTGITSEQLFSNFHPDDRKLLSAEIVRHMKGETDFFVCDYRVLQPDGSVRWVEDRGIGERDESGRVVRMGGSVTSISRRKEVEERLSRSESLLQAVINNTPAVVYIKDKEGRYLLVNRQFSTLFGLSRDEAKGRTDVEIFPAPQAAQYRANDREVERTKKPVEAEEVAQQEDGLHTYLSVKFPLFDDGGEIYAVCGISTDITARKVMEDTLAHNQATLEMKVKERTQQLEDSKKRFKDFAEVGSDWFWETGPDHRFTAVSESNLILTQVDPNELYTQDRRAFAYPDDVRNNPEKWDAHYADLNAHRPFKDFEYRYLPPNGTMMHIRVSGRPFFADDGAFLGYRGVGSDITSEKMAETALREAKKQADEASHAKSEFLSRMSHELRTPLNGILGFAQLLELDKDDNLTEEQVRFIGDIRRSGDHLLELINEVLDLARIESGGLDIKLEPLAPAEVMGECLGMIRPLAEKTGIHVINSLAMDQSAVEVISDRVRLRQIFVNLVTNAIKYNRINGSVTLRLENGAPGFLRVCISDIGPGIPEKNLEEIFQPFTRLNGSKAVEGTGVGLAVTRKLVELLGGDIGVESTVGKGSTFWVDLPRNVGALAKVEKGCSAIASGKLAEGQELGGQKLILYVEDNKANIRFMRELLRRVPNVEILIAETGEDGIRLVREKSPDLVLMDINLPGMNGFEALTEIRRSFATPKIPVIALSALAMPDDVQRGLSAGFDGYLTKPLNVSETLAVILNALR